MAYHDEMVKVRRKLLEQYWPRVLPAVQRLMKQQNAPLTANQFEAVCLWLQQDFHMGQVDRAYLDLLIKNAEAEVLYGQTTRATFGRYVTVADCEDMTALQFARVIHKLFEHFGYQVDPLDESGLILRAPMRPPILVGLEVHNIVIHQPVIDHVIQRQREHNMSHAILVTVGRFGEDIVLPPGTGTIELWDGDRLGALLDRVRLDPAVLLS
ncbi:MAG: hypothetical protein C7B44_12965 [Sulfobacillus thermosulfidooxidans]|nr:MAG: hypothetical protein C7B44_12965 [Sulfobacillus thermosulfidooxidans]